MVSAIGTCGGLIKDVELDGIEERMVLLEEAKEQNGLESGN